MKKFKKLMAAALALVMLIALAVVPASATDSITITVNDAIEGITYSAYKIFAAEVNGTNVVYTIEISSAWWDFVKPASDSNNTTAGDGNAYVTLTPYPGSTTKYYVEAKTSTESDKTSFTDTTAAAFAKLAKTYAETSGDKVTADGDNLENETAKVTTITNADGTTTSTATITVSGPGYYLITSSAGSAGMLKTLSGTSASLTEKNDLPAIEKTATDANGKTLTSVNYGDTIYYTITVYCEEDAQDLSYTIHDAMTDLTPVMTTGSDGKEVFTVTVKHIRGEGDSAKETLLTAGTQYMLTMINDDTTCSAESTDEDGETSGAIENCTFEIKLEESNTIKAGDKITVTYTAKVTGTNPSNKATLTTDKQEVKDPTIEDEVTIYTYGFTMTKVDATNTNATLSGAEFQLTKTETATENNTETTIPYYATVDSETQKFNGWTTTSTDAATFTTDSNGQITVEGLAEGTYSLTETKAPTGYKLPTDRVWTIIIQDGAADGDLDGTDSETPADADTATVTYGTTPVNVTVTSNDTTAASAKKNMLTFTITNSTSDQLPTTGGIGTTIFYVVGGVLVLAALVLLVSKKRVEE